jgi:hypothetical protein
LAESAAITGSEGITDLSASMVRRLRDVGRLTEADAIAEQMTKGAARIGEWRLRSTVRIEPGALDAGNVALKVGYGSKQRRPAFERSVVRLAIVDRRVIAQGRPVEPSGDAAGAQISLGRCARKGTTSLKQAARRFGRAARWWWRVTEVRRRWRRGRWQGEKAARFVHGLAEIAQVAVKTDQVQEIAMLAGRSVGPFAGRTRAGIGSAKPHVEAAARRVHDIADDPVMPLAMSVGEVMTAHGLGGAREAAREIGGAQHRTCPDQAARGLARRSGWWARSAESNAGPRSAATGTKSRKRQAMISEVSPSAFS